jgi:hypothetical protein
MQITPVTARLGAKCLCYLGGVGDRLTVILPINLPARVFIITKLFFNGATTLMADHTEAVVQLMGITGEDYPVAFALLEVRNDDLRR